MNMNYFFKKYAKMFCPMDVEYTGHDRKAGEKALTTIRVGLQSCPWGQHQKSSSGRIIRLTHDRDERVSAGGRILVLTKSEA